MWTFKDSASFPPNVLQSDNTLIIINADKKNEGVYQCHGTLLQNQQFYSYGRVNIASKLHFQSVL